LMLVFMIYGFYVSYDAMWDIAGFLNEPPIIIWETIKLLTSQTPIYFWMWCMLKKNNINNLLIKPLLYALIAIIFFYFIEFIFLIFGVPKLFWDLYILYY
jgi:hypothetical protein